MATVYARQQESFESLFRRFKKEVQQARILTETRRRRYFEKPSVGRKRAAAKKLSKSRKTTLRDLRRRR